MEEGSLEPVEQFGVGHLWRRWDLVLGAHRGDIALRFATLAKVFDDPFEAGDLLGHRFLVELPPAVHRCTARDPVGPDEPLGLDVGRLRVARGVAVGAYHFAVVAVRLVVLGEAEVLVENAPASDFDLLVFADKSADFLARLLAATVGAAATFAGARRSGESNDQQRENQRIISHEIRRQRSEALRRPCLSWVWITYESGSFAHV